VLYAFLVTQKKISKKKQERIRDLLPQEHVAAALQLCGVAGLDEPVELELPRAANLLPDALPLAVPVAVHHAHQVRVFVFGPNFAPGPAGACATVVHLCKRKRGAGGYNTKDEAK